MLPSKTIEKVGATSILGEGTKFEAREFYTLEGFELNELAVLAVRFNHKWDDANETRDWQNRLNVILGNALRRGVM